MEIEEIKALFNKEFRFIRDRFAVYDLPVAEAETSQKSHIWKPGVYVWWQPSEAVKVGRHLTNARKRAFEHVRDNTAGIMAALRENSEARLLLFNVVDVEDRHWPAALEIFFEERLDPLVSSQRLG